MPVVMYHYVNNLPGGITVSPAVFAEHCRVLAQKGWRGVGLDEAEAFLIQGERLPPKSLLITFDDGFLDNYLYALPLLRKYGHKGVVFAVSNRVEPGGVPRVPLADVLSGVAPDIAAVSRPMRQTSQGHSIREDVFLNQAEARDMDAEGTLAVASHSRGHYGVYIGPEYKDFFRPKYQGRTFYRTEEAPVWGLPDFSVKAGLLYTAFLPNPELVEAVKRLVPQTFDAAAEFFAEKANVDELTALVSGFGKNLGRYETESERKERMEREIAGGKAELEALLGHAVRTLCWPWGKYSEEALALAREAGFQLFFTTQEGVNPPGSPLAVHRFKGKDKDGAWLASRAWIYASPWLGRLYSKIRI